MHWRRRPQAGRSAEAYYRQALQEWRDHPFLRGLRFFFLALLAASAGIQVFFVQQMLAWSLGLTTALCMCAYMCLHDWAPAHIENWHTGAEGERKTERVLVKLERAGWRARHDLEAQFGNIDHLLVGPGGVFLLDSKQYLGRVAVADGVVEVSRRANPRGGYRDAKLARNLRGEAWRISQHLAAEGLRCWVQPVAVVWSGFEQQCVEQAGVVFIHGSRLEEWLLQRERRLGEPFRERLSSHLEQLRPVAA